MEKKAVGEIGLRDDNVVPTLSCLSGSDDDTRANQELEELLKDVIEESGGAPISLDIDCPTGEAALLHPKPPPPSRPSSPAEAITGVRCKNMNKGARAAQASGAVQTELEDFIQTPISLTV